jgi:hypothetical protein
MIAFKFKHALMDTEYKNYRYLFFVLPSVWIHFPAKTRRSTTSQQRKHSVNPRCFRPSVCLDCSLSRQNSPIHNLTTAKAFSKPSLLTMTPSPNMEQSNTQKLRRGNIRAGDMAMTMTMSPTEQTASAEAKTRQVTARNLPMITPLLETNNNNAEEEQMGLDANTVIANRSLFPASKISLLVSPSPSSSPSSSKRKAQSLSSSSPAPAAKRRLIFGKYVDLKQCAPNVNKAYKIVRKLTGSIGGNGYCGPIYGELTMGSMQKMIDLMMKHTSLDKTSRFIDVGSGIGKPNIHVAQYPGVAFSCGVEMEHARWSLGMTCLKAVLDEAVKENDNDNHDSEDNDVVRGNTVFLHKNITEAETFDPFTHVYMFSIGT